MACLLKAESFENLHCLQWQLTLLPLNNDLFFQETPGVSICFDSKSHNSSQSDHCSTLLCTAMCTPLLPVAYYPNALLMYNDSGKLVRWWRPKP